MILDLSEQEPDDSALRFDLVVIGTGPAGGVVVAELNRLHPGLSIGVLESGRRRPWAFADRLRKAPWTGMRIKPHSRERVLGGASTTWSGLSSPMDPIELRARPWLEVSGWPLDSAALKPYYQAAADRYRFAAPDDFDVSQKPGGALADVRAKRAFQPEWRGLEEKLFLAAAEPQNFGTELAPEYERDNVTLLFDASVVELVHEAGEHETMRRVVAARIKDSGGSEHLVYGQRFVVATGGIENARLLLLSGLGTDATGRYMMNHPKNYAGIVTLAEPTRSLPYFFGCISKGFAGYGGLRLVDETETEQELVNNYVRFEPLFPWSDNRGVEALVHLVKRSQFIMTFWKRSKKDAVIELRDYSETGDDSELDEEQLSYLGLVARVLKHLPSVLAYVKSRLLDRGGPLIKRVRVRNFMEMEPVASNRVTLSDERDVHDSPLPHVTHAPTARDERSLVALHKQLATELERTGFGTLSGGLHELPAGTPWPIDQDASHHMGTTRMGDDPATSVCDVHQRAHGTTNLYLSGASVFPTSGCANPTYTLVALAVRLAEHLNENMAENQPPPTQGSRS
jgi:choline dehydrogenase-like flavoprotein